MPKYKQKYKGEFIEIGLLYAGLYAKCAGVRYPIFINNNLIHLMPI